MSLELDFKIMQLASTVSEDFERKVGERLGWSIDEDAIYGYHFHTPSGFVVYRKDYNSKQKPLVRFISKEEADERRKRVLGYSFHDEKQEEILSKKRRNKHSIGLRLFMWLRGSKG